MPESVKFARRFATKISIVALAVGTASAITGCRTASVTPRTDARTAMSPEARPARESRAAAVDVVRGLPTEVGVRSPRGIPVAWDALQIGGPGTPAAAAGAPPAGDAAAASGGDDLALKSSDPTVPLRSLMIFDWYSPGSHQLDDDEPWNTIMLRAVLPFKLGGQQNILRISQPIYTDTPGDVTGVGDITLFNLLVFKGCGFTYSLGADVSIPWGADGLSSEKWSGGPAAVLMVPKGKWVFGGLVQNYFSFAGDSDAPGVAQTIFQPVATLSLGNGRTIGLSELAFTYDWNLEDWTSAPFGLTYAQVVKIGCQATKFSISADYNFIDTYVAPDLTLRFGVAFLFP